VLDLGSSDWSAPRLTRLGLGGPSHPLSPLGCRRWPPVGRGEVVKTVEVGVSRFPGLKEKTGRGGGTQGSSSLVMFESDPEAVTGNRNVVGYEGNDDAIP
jgi:hypothetical protein